MGRHGTWKRRLRTIESWVCVTIIIISCACAAVSFNWCITFARGDFYFVLTDGYFALPWPDGQPRIWDDWGWFVQSPWFDRSAGLPVLGVYETRQIGGLGIHVDFSFLIALSVVWLSIRRIENATDNHAAYIAVVGWLLYFAGAAGFVVTHSYGFDDYRRLTAVIGACLAVPASFSAIKRVVRSRRARIGYCSKCGYNLFGNTSGRCSECGTPIAEAGV